MMAEDILIVRMRERDRVARALRPLSAPLRRHYACDDMTPAQVGDAVQQMFDKFIRCRLCGRWTDQWTVAQLFGVVGTCRNCALDT